jgi:hypothetical protein
VSLDVPGVTREQLTIDVDGAVVRVQTVQGRPAPVPGRLRAAGRTSTPKRPRQAGERRADAQPRQEEAGVTSRQIEVK